MSGKLHLTIRSGGPASWAIRVVATVVVVWLVLWVPTRASDSLVDTCTTALVWMSAAMSLNLLVGFTGQLLPGDSMILIPRSLTPKHGMKAVTNYLMKQMEWSLKLMT